MHISSVIRERPFSLPAMAPLSCHHSWVLFRGTPLNPLLILTNRYLHRFTPQPTFQTRSKYGPTLQVSYVVLPFITSRPLRLPYAPHTLLAGFTQLESCLPQLESCGDAGIPGPYLRYLSPHAIGHTPGPHQVHMPFCFPDDSGLLPKIRGSACIPAQRGLSLNQTLPVITVRSSFTKLHHSLYATACGFGRHPRLGKTRYFSEPPRYRVGASSAHVLPHEPALCLHIQKGN